MRADGQTDVMRQIGPSRNFVNSPNKQLFLIACLMERGLERCEGQCPDAIVVTPIEELDTYHDYTRG